MSKNSHLITALRNELSSMINMIDTGNSNLTDVELQVVVDTLKRYTHKDTVMSKYTSCRYINVSRATFDNLVRDGKLPPGDKVEGFKELRWYKSDLDKYKVSKN